MNHLKGKFRLLTILFILVISCYGLVYAEGDGSGEGEHREDPIVIASSNIEDGDTGVSVNTKIVLEFNKNVVNMSVAEKNKNCFSLTDESGRQVNLSVSMGDDQIDPSIKRIITVIPSTSLQKGTKYQLTVSGELTAKNGVSLRTPITISFSTEGKKVSALVENKKAVESFSSAAAIQTDKSPKPIKEQKALNEEEKNSSKIESLKVTDINWLKVMSLGSIIIGFSLLAIYIILRIKHTDQNKKS